MEGESSEVLLGLVQVLLLRGVVVLGREESFSLEGEGREQVEEFGLEKVRVASQMLNLYVLCAFKSLFIFSLNMLAFSSSFNSSLRFDGAQKRQLQLFKSCGRLEGEEGEEEKEEKEEEKKREEKVGSLEERKREREERRRGGEGRRKKRRGRECQPLTACLESWEVRGERSKWRKESLPPTNTLTLPPPSEEVLEEKEEAVFSSTT